MLAGLLVGLAALGMALAALRSPRPAARTTAGATLVAAGLGLGAARQFHLAVPIGLLGLGLLCGAPGGSRKIPSAAGSRSGVRTAALAMELDHDSGAMDGDVLAGRFAGARLSDLATEALDTLAEELADDPDSLGLLRAYLERRGGPQRSTPPPSPPGGEMSEADAYRILGLAPQAGPEEVRAAHRRLIRKLHPDHGGSDALAAMINAAKARLER